MSCEFRAKGSNYLFFLLLTAHNPQLLLSLLLLLLFQRTYPYIAEANWRTGVAVCL